MNPKDIEAAKHRAITTGVFRVANLRDIIASKKASDRKKDLIELPLLESFQEECEKLHPPTLRTALDVAKDNPRHH